MSGIKYQFGEIEARAAEMLAGHNNIQNELQTLKQSLQPMVSSWEGESAVAYRAAQARWDNSARAITELLNAIIGRLNNANANMQQANRAAAQTWGG
ncbi:MAG: WXG100 family type VII secretion target [Corynebacterium sp.]|nr:WXG100 family type VII secretion target [Corynebacterium sp.]